VARRHSSVWCGARFPRLARAGECVLAPLLPGVRDARTPFAVGCAWFVFFWLVVPARWLEPVDDADRLARLADLVEWLQPSARLAAAAFSVYVVGSLVCFTPDHRWVCRLVERVSDVQGDYWRERFEYDDFRTGGRVSAAKIPTGGAPRHLLLAALQLRALAVNREVYAEHDRYAAEATLRMNLAIPLAAIAYVLVDERFGTLAACSAAAAGVWMAYRGLSRARLSYLVLYRAHRDGVLGRPAVSPSIGSADTDNDAPAPH
jgi:hypothetical protein